MTTKPRVLSRRELYDLIWATPMSKLAAEFGISDRGLAKICERHRVTGPTRGYWAKLAAGKKVRQSIFREVNDPVLNRIIINSSLADLPEGMEEVLETARAERIARRSLPAEEPAAAFEIVEQPHKAIAATARSLRKSKPNSWGVVSAVGDGMCGITVHQRTAERVISFLHQLATLLQERGLQLIPDGQRMSLAIGPDKIAFTVTERSRGEKHEPTAEDLELQAQYDERAERARRRNDWSDSTLFGKKAYPEIDIVYLGQLAFSVEGYSHGLRRTFADGKTQTVERLLPDIVSQLEVLLANEKARREEREERERQWAEMSRRRDLAKRRKEREQKRIEMLRAAGEAFPEAVDDVIPFLATETGQAHMTTIHSLGDADAALYDLAPGKLLDLVDAIVGDSDAGSVHGLKRVLDRVLETDATIVGLAKYQRLRQLASRDI